jgi:hypothetical protein
MAVVTTPCPTLFHKPTQAFPNRLALDDPVSLACFAPIGGNSAKVKCTRTPCRLVAAWWPLEGNHHRFLRMHGEAEASKSLRQDLHHPAGVRFQHAADEEIIGKTRQKALALHPGLYVLDKPCVQHLMQIGSKDGALPHCYGTLPPSALRTGRQLVAAPSSLVMACLQALATCAIPLGDAVYGMLDIVLSPAALHLRQSHLLVLSFSVFASRVGWGGGR